MKNAYVEGGSGSVVGIATGYGMDGPEIQSRCGEIFRTCPDRPWGPATGWTLWGSNSGGDEIFRTCPDRSWCPSNLLYNEYRVFPGGKEQPGRDPYPSPPSSAVVKKE